MDNPNEVQPGGDDMQNDMSPVGEPMQQSDASAHPSSEQPPKKGSSLRVVIPVLIVAIIVAVVVYLVT